MKLKATKSMTYPAQREFPNNTSASPCLCTPVLDNSRVRVPVERVQLELSLIPDLRRESLVAGHEEVSAADDFGIGHASSCLHITSKMDVPLHGLGTVGDDEYGSKTVVVVVVNDRGLRLWRARLH